MLSEDTAGWSGRENLHTVKVYGPPLGTCECGRKLAIPLYRLGHLDGNMAPIQVAQARLPRLRLEEVEGDAFRERAGDRAFLTAPSSGDRLP